VSLAGFRCCDVNLSAPKDSAEASEVEEKEPELVGD
jgi:hypothetical protein